MLPCGSPEGLTSYLHILPVLIAENQGESIQFPAQDCLAAAQVTVDIRDAFPLIC